jgi:hypothetical protein
MAGEAVDISIDYFFIDMFLLIMSHIGSSARLNISHDSHKKINKVLLIT